MPRVLRNCAAIAALVLLLGSAHAGGQAPTPVGPRSFGSELTLTNVRAHGKTLVATGSDGRIIVSRNDGRSWAAVSSPVGPNLRGVAYGGGRWVAVGDLGAAATSTDALHWFAVDLGSKGAFRAITYSGGTWIAGANEGTVLVSVDGAQTWTPASTGSQLPFWGATSYRGLALLTGDNGEIISSRDGTTWTLVQAPVPFEPIRDSRAFLWQVVHGPPGFVAVGARGATAFSRKGARWSAPRSPLTQTLRGVAYGRGRYVTVGEHGQIGTSRDGRRWTLVKKVPTDEILRGVTFTGDAFVAVGDFGTVLRSLDGLHWKIVLDGSKQGLASVTYGQSRFVAVGAGGRILSSPSGEIWTPVASPTRRHLYGVGSGPGGFVAVGARGVVLRSANGSRWLRGRSGTRQSLRTVTVLGGRWYAAGDEGVVLSSADGVRWGREATLAPFSIRELAEGNGVQVAAGAGIIATRPGTGPWILNPAGDYRFKTGVAFGGGTFVVVGHAGGIVSSSDGIQWTPAPVDTVGNLEAVAYGAGLWVTGGLAFLATSPNAATWTQRSIPTRSTIRGLTYAAGRWVAVGDHGVILTSTDGVTWS